MSTETVRPLGDYYFAIQTLEPNAEGKLVGRQRKPRPFIERVREFGSDARAALEALEAEGGSTGQRRIVARLRGVDADYGNFPTGWETVFGPDGRVTAIWEEVKVGKETT